MEAKRASDVRIWLVTLFFLSCIVGGGVFLALYMTLPEEQDTVWYAMAGMVMVAIPWFFWFLTFLYRIIWKGHVVSSPPNGGAAVAPAGASTMSMTKNIESPESVGGGERRVRFGGATVMESADGGQQHVLGQGQPWAQGSNGGCGGDITTSSEGSSLASRECEVPLALAMSA